MHTRPILRRHFHHLGKEEQGIVDEEDILITSTCYETPNMAKVALSLDGNAL
jgi:hypothetical protein